MTEDLLSLTEAVEAAGADIAPDYAAYVQLAFAIATDCGEAGRECFHRLCRLSAKYDSANADRLFTSALRDRRGDIHIGTAFHLARRAGVTVKTTADDRKTDSTDSNRFSTLTHTRACAREELKDNPNGDDDDLDCSGGDNEETTEGSEPIAPLPTLGSYDWPWPLADITAYGTTAAQRDALLLGGLTVLGACMGRHVRCAYGGRLLSPCLQTFVVAPPASGKGALSLARLIAEPIHDDIRRRVKAAVDEYRKAKAAYDLMGKERARQEPPQQPADRMFIIPGNNTGTGILQNLIDSDGEGIICESEADTVTTAIGTDYGHWSDTLRKAFDHDRLSYNRRTDREYREVKKSYLAVLLSGTPAQVKPLIPSAENGLFSRQLFYYMPAIRQWQDQFDAADTDLEATFKAIGRQWKRSVDGLKAGGVYDVRLDKGQRTEFNRLFAALFARAGIANGNEMSSSVARLAINACRMLSVVAVLRAMGCATLMTPNKDTARDNLKDGIISRWDVTVTPQDFSAVMGLVEPLYRHATHILSFLPSTEVRRRSNADRDALFAALGRNFTRQEAFAKAGEMGISTNTVLTWLQRLKKRGTIESAGRGRFHLS